MNATPLYDLAPLLQVMGMGLVVASGPLAWLWVRQRQAALPERLYRLTLLTLFLTFDLVLFGSFTRLTDSGLGCPDWPGCYGEFNPAAAHARISEAQLAQPTGPVTHGKAWVEMIHRYLATGVGVLILVLAIVAVAEALRRRRLGLVGGPSVAWPLLTLAWVCVQGAFGALTVTMKLFPAIVTLHLMGGLMLLALLAWQSARYRPAAPSGAWLPPALRRYTAAALALLTVQDALGGWVSTNYAVLACDTFPTCQGQWWPPMDFAQALDVWRPLGLTSAGVPVSFSALTAIHYLHRLAAYGVMASLGLLAWQMSRHAAGRGTARVLAATLLLQFLTGLANVVLGWPLAGAVLHTGGAAALVLILTWTLARPGPAHTARPPVYSSAPTGAPAA